MVMTKEHPRWQEFVDRLEGPEGCDFKEIGEGNGFDLSWNCGGENDKSLAQAILSDMGLTYEEIEESCEYFISHGGYCDCEILFNMTG